MWSVYTGEKYGWTEEHSASLALSGWAAPPPPHLMKAGSMAPMKA